MKKPKIPTNPMKRIELSVAYSTLKEINDKVKAHGVMPAAVDLEVEDNYGSHEIIAVFRKPTYTDKEFNAITLEQRRALHKYNKWYVANKDEVEAKKKAVNGKRQATRKAKLLKEKKKIEDQLKKLN